MLQELTEMGVWAQAGVGGIKELAVGPGRGWTVRKVMAPMWWGPFSREECGELGRVALAAASLKHPCQPNSVPVRKHGQGQARSRAGGGRAQTGASGCVGQGSGLPAPLPSLTPTLLGVPLLFVIPWGIVKYLYEDEG